MVGWYVGGWKFLDSLSKREGLHRTRYLVHVYCILWVDSRDLEASCPHIIASEYTATAVINTLKQINATALSTSPIAGFNMDLYLW